MESWGWQLVWDFFELATKIHSGPKLFHDETEEYCKSLANSTIWKELKDPIEKAFETWKFDNIVAFGLASETTYPIQLPVGAKWRVQHILL